MFPKLDVILPIQVLYGCFPIARVKNPYSVIRFLAERLDPPIWTQLGLVKVKSDEDDTSAAGDDTWSAWAICESLAEKHGWKSRRGGRLDVYRAANFLLRAALSGRQGVALGFLPPSAAEEAAEKEKSRAE